MKKLTTNIVIVVIQLTSISNLVNSSAIPQTQFGSKSANPSSEPETKEYKNALVLEKTVVIHIKPGENTTAQIGDISLGKFDDSFKPIGKENAKSLLEQQNPEQEDAPANGKHDEHKLVPGKAVVIHTKPGENRTVQIGDISLEQVGGKDKPVKKEKREITNEEKSAVLQVTSPVVANRETHEFEPGEAVVIHTKPEENTTVQIGDISFEYPNGKNRPLRRENMDDASYERDTADMLADPLYILGQKSSGIQDDASEKQGEHYSVPGKAVVMHTKPGENTTVQIGDISLGQDDENNNLTRRENQEYLKAGNFERDPADVIEANPLYFLGETNPGLQPDATANMNMDEHRFIPDKAIVIHMKPDKHSAGDFAVEPLFLLEKKYPGVEVDVSTNTKQNEHELVPGKAVVIHTKPGENTTIEIGDISLDQLAGKDKPTGRENPKNLDAASYERDTGDMVEADPQYFLGQKNPHMSTEQDEHEFVSGKAVLIHTKPGENTTIEIGDISLDQLDGKDKPMRRGIRENTDSANYEKGNMSEVTSTEKESLMSQLNTVIPKVENDTNNNNALVDVSTKQTELNQPQSVESTTSISDREHPVPAIDSRLSEVQLEAEKGPDRPNEQQRTEAPQKRQEEEEETTNHNQIDNTQTEKLEETTHIDIKEIEKPTLLERMKHNRHWKFHSDEEKEEDKPVGPVPCTCGVFLSGQFKKGSKQQPKGMPVLTQEMDTPFMNNAMGNRQCTNKCLELIIKHLPKSSEIICATVDRENVFKERAYLFVKNHNDKWHGTNLSAGREFCCKDNTPYKCPVS